MMKRALLLLGASIAALLASCQCATASRCSTAADCGRGQVCTAGECVTRGTDASEETPDAFVSGPIDAASDATTLDAACPVITSDPVEARGPIDVILIVDGTGSVGEVRAGVQREVANLEPALSRAAIDYRLIVLASCGFTIDGIPPARLSQFPLGIGSADRAAFARVLDNYAMRVASEDCVMDGGPGWGSLLRPDARKVFIHFTDSAGGEGTVITGYAGTFDEELPRLDPEMFLDAASGEPNFTYHAFLGHAGRAMGANPVFCPDEDLVTGTCMGPFGSPPGPGPGFQGVARRTGGFRAPICALDEYATIFDAIADRTIAEAQDCTFDLPPAPTEFMLNLDAIAVQWRSEGGETRDYRQVMDVSACTPESFYLDRASDPPRVVLCPAACSFVRTGLCTPDGALPFGTLSVRFACDPMLL